MTALLSVSGLIARPCFHRGGERLSSRVERQIVIVVPRFAQSAALAGNYCSSPNWAGGGHKPHRPLFLKPDQHVSLPREDIAKLRFS